MNAMPLPGRTVGAVTRERFLDGTALSNAYVVEVQTPVNLLRFGAGLREFGHTDASVNVCGTELDDKKCLNASVPFTGDMGYGIGDALSTHNHMIKRIQRGTMLVHFVIILVVMHLC